VYKDPVLQVQIQRKQLIRWLEERAFNIPVETFVVFTNEKSMLQNIDKSKEFDRTFVTLENVLFKIEKTYEKYTKDVLLWEEINTLIQLFIKENNPLKTNLIEKYGVQQKHLALGLLCYDCQVTLQRIHGKWKCFRCNNGFKTVYKQ